MVRIMNVVNNVSKLTKRHLEEIMNESPFAVSEEEMTRYKKCLIDWNCYLIENYIAGELGMVIKTLSLFL